jgi:hypothetical protein
VTAAVQSILFGKFSLRATQITPFDPVRLNTCIIFFHFLLYPDATWMSLPAG